MTQKMRSRYDELHDKYYKLLSTKSGTRYERLAAVVFKTLDSADVVIHDLRLLGEKTGAKHQIDVTIENQGVKQRKLVECKDFDTSNKKVGIGIVRDFYGAVVDVKPQEAWVITCTGFTKQAVKYAQGMGIRLAILREFQESDWRNRVRRYKIDCVLIDITTPRVQILTASMDDMKKLKQDFARYGISLGMLHTTQPVFLHLPSGNLQLNEFIEARIKDTPDEPPGSVRRSIGTPRAKISVAGGVRYPVQGVILEYEIKYVTETMMVSGEQIGILLLQTVNGATVAIWEEDLKAFRFTDYGEVTT